MADILLSGASQGLIWAVLAFGVYISYRLLDIADLSCEGTITLGASAAALLIWRGAHPALALLAAFAAGLAAGCITGLLHTLLRIPAILAGILTMISCYSVNIHIMSAATGTAGTANLSLINYQSGTLFTQLKQLLGLGKQDAALVFGAVFTGLLIAAIYWFFGTEAGCAIRATGDNEKMCCAAGINTDAAKVIGLALSNGLIALAGALLCQYQGYADVNMGVGAIVIGLASIIIGEALCGRIINFALRLLFVALGSVAYRVVVAVVIYSGMPSTDLKLLTAAVVVAALTLTSFGPRAGRRYRRKVGVPHA